MNYSLRKHEKRPMFLVGCDYQFIEMMTICYAPEPTLFEHNVPSSYIDSAANSSGASGVLEHLPIYKYLSVQLYHHPAICKH